MVQLLERLPSDRKLRLFVAACGRRAGPGLADEHLRVVEAAERLADGQCTAREFVLTCRAANPTCGPQVAGVGRYGGSDIAFSRHLLLGLPDDEDCPQDAGLLRELFGPLPFRPVRIDPRWLAWQDGTVGRLARSIYAEDRFEHLPVLADALEDAGCADADLLSHCRSRGGHTRGCWAVDLVLGHRAGAARVRVEGRPADQVVAECVAAATAVLCETRGRLAELLAHPDLGRVGRLEFYDYRDLEEADLRALESRGYLGPIKAIGLPDDSESAERVIGLLARLPDAGGLETLTLVWDAYLSGNVSAILEREVEVNRLVGKDVCLIDASY
jgi:hypothetical protein